MKDIKKIKIGVFGSTGLVGQKIISVLHQFGVPACNVIAFTSGLSKKTSISYGESDVLNLVHMDKRNDTSFDIAFLAVENAISQNLAVELGQKGVVVIDKSSYFRMDSDVPLIVPGVNDEALLNGLAKNIIANPNCSTIQLVSVLKPLANLYKLKRVIISTYQSVSGAGKAAMDILDNQTKSVLVHQGIADNGVFQKPIAFNVIPQIDDITETGESKEELKMMRETLRILSSDFEISASCARVPVFVGHSMYVHVEFEEDPQISMIKKEISKHKDLVLSKQLDEYVTPIEVTNEDEVYISRLYKDPRIKNSIKFWCAADNLLKGAALNGVMIADVICKKYSSLLK